MRRKRREHTMSSGTDDFIAVTVGLGVTTSQLEFAGVSVYEYFSMIQ